MNVGNIITRPLITISSGTTLLDVARLMVRQNLGLLVICDAKDQTKLVGVISERDIIKSIAAGRTLNDLVDDVSTKRVITVEFGGRRGSQGR
jgi:CBS domain-containing protein